MRNASKVKRQPVCESLESRALLTTFTVTNPGATGPGTLAAAITMANQNHGPDTINFALPSASIALGHTRLPTITSPVTINGYSQPGTSANTSTNPSDNNAIVLDLVSSGGASPLLRVGIGGSGSQISGLGFTNVGAFISTAIELDHAFFVTLGGDQVGYGNGSQSRFGTAIDVDGGAFNTIGGDLAGTPALQTAMTQYNVGIHLHGGTAHNAVVGDIVGGPNFQGRAPLQEVGIQLDRGANFNTIHNNIIFKNIVPINDHGRGNSIENNTIVDRLTGVVAPGQPSSPGDGGSDSSDGGSGSSDGGSGSPGGGTSHHGHGGILGGIFRLLGDLF